MHRVVPPGLRAVVVLIAAWTATASPAGAIGGVAPGEIRHVVLIVVDDLRPALGCYGDETARTPNIDRLAKDSLRFDAAYCQFPQCMPSRASLLTGLRPDGFYLMTGDLADDGQPTLAAHLQSHGVYTAAIGKVSHRPNDDAASWDSLQIPARDPARRRGYLDDYQLPENRERADAKKKIDWRTYHTLTDPLPPLSEAADAPEGDYVDGWVAERAVQLLEERAGETGSTFLAIGFHRPHLPWTAPRAYWEMHDRDSIRIADNPFFPTGGVGKGDHVDLRHYGDAEVTRLYADLNKYTDADFPVLSEAKQRELIHAYRASVSFMDAQVGRTLAALQRLGMAEETAVIFTSDHGFHLGEHKLWAKLTSFREANRVPLLLRVPGETDGGSVAAPVELVDLYPTVCELLNLPRPPHLDGRPLPLSPEPTEGIGPGEAPAAFSATRDAWTIVTPRYRYTFHHAADREPPPLTIIPGRGAEELYDLRADPGENRNLAGDPTLQAVRAELKRRLFATYADGGAS